MKCSTTVGKLAAALAAAQGEFPAVTKDGKNPDVHSKYATLDNIVAAVRPVLARHKIAVLQGVGACEGARIVVETTLAHESGEWMTTEAWVPLVGRRVKGGGFGEPDPQAAGSAITYARRYGLAAALSIAAEEDDDGRQSSRPRENRDERPARRDERRPAPAQEQPAQPAPEAASDAQVATLKHLLKQDGVPAAVIETVKKAFAEGRPSAAKVTKWIEQLSTRAGANAPATPTSEPAAATAAAA